MRLIAAIAIAALATGTIVAASAAPPSDPCRVAEDAKSIAAAVRAGDCLREAHRIEESIAAYKEGLAIEGKGSKELFLGLSAVYLDAQMLEPALEAALAAERLSPSDPAVLVGIGIVYEDMGANSEALRYLQAAVALRPSDGRAWRNIGYVLLQQGEPEAAVEPLQKAIQLDAKDWKAHHNLGNAYAEIYRTGTEQIRALTRSMPSGGGAATAPAYVKREALVKKLNATDYKKLSVDQEREAARINSTDHRLWFSLAGRLVEFRGGDATEIINAYQRALEIKPDYYPALHDLAVAQSRSRRYDEAYETCDLMEKYRHGSSDIAQIRGDLDLATGRYEEAVERFLAGLEREETADLHVGLARAYRKLGRTEDSSRELARAKQLLPQQAMVFDAMLQQDRR